MAITSESWDHYYKENYKEILSTMSSPPQPLSQDQSSLLKPQTPPFLMPPLPRLDDVARTMLLMRLDGFKAIEWLRPKDWLVCHVMDDHVITFFCFGNDSGFVEDEKELFPSDGLVAQLRILRK